MKYANMKYDRIGGRINLGDDMQLLAIENLYKHMGIDYRDVVRINYTDLATYNGEYVVLPIAFPFASYSNGIRITQFSDRIIPVFLSLSIVTDVLDGNETEYLKRFEPIGCRDLRTLRTMRKHGITAYLNGCMTLTFPSDERAGKGENYILADVPATIRSHIPLELRENAMNLSPICMNSKLDASPEDVARERYDFMIANAKCVITTRLHVALPLIAAGVPTILMKEEYSYRFGGIDAIVPIFTPDSFADINWNPTVPNIEKHKNQVLSLSATRLLQTANDYSQMYDLSYSLENVERPEEYVESVSNAVKYINYHWNVNEPVRYVLWGATQTASVLYNYIQDHYPNAIIKGLIDEYRSVELCDEVSQPSNEISIDENTYMFTCTAAAIEDANTFIKAHGIKGYFHCFGQDDELIYTGKEV